MHGLLHFVDILVVETRPQEQVCDARHASSPFSSYPQIHRATGKPCPKPGGNHSNGVQPCILDERMKTDLTVRLNQTRSLPQHRLPLVGFRRTSSQIAHLPSARQVRNPPRHQVICRTLRMKTTLLTSPSARLWKG